MKFKKQTISRDMLKKSGFYDGRFAPKIFTDKKKESKKRECRKQISFS